ncbi:MAG: hypothetical protein RMJ87_12915 [Cytophagales bacterium]|nr:hypothetical protein [Bernardetiaceae bacterium]MDW8205923.1 hypothetical protein [Cytophagales bacterium]
MKKVEEKQQLSEFLSIDEGGKLVGIEKVLCSESGKSSYAIGNRLTMLFFGLVILVIGGVCAMLTWHNSITVAAQEWIVFGLICLTLILPILFFLAILRFLLR